MVNETAGLVCVLLLTTALTMGSGEQTMVGVLRSKPNRFSTLTDLIKESGLENFFESGTNMTLLAPTNDAFQSLSNDTLTRMMSSSPNMKKMVLAHVVSGILSAKTLSDGDVLATLDGGSLTVNADGKVKSVGGANIIDDDILTSNGTILVIDHVLAN